MSPLYEAYGNEKTLPNRKARKGLRNTVFIKNKVAARKLRAERVALRREQAGEEQA